MKQITIGQHVVEWVAKLTNEYGNYGAAVGIGLAEGNEIAAGVVFNEYNGASMCMHVASNGSKRWMTKTLLFTVFDYAFRQAKVSVLIGLIGEGNLAARRFIKHIGFTLSHALKGAHPTGDLLIFTLYKHDCKWVKNV